MSNRFVIFPPARQSLLVLANLMLQALLMALTLLCLCLSYADVSAQGLQAMRAITAVAVCLLLATGRGQPFESGESSWMDAQEPWAGGLEVLLLLPPLRAARAPDSMHSAPELLSGAQCSPLCPSSKLIRYADTGGPGGLAFVGGGADDGADSFLPPCNGTEAASLTGVCCDVEAADLSYCEDGECRVRQERGGTAAAVLLACAALSRLHQPGSCSPPLQPLCPTDGNCSPHCTCPPDTHSCDSGVCTVGVGNPEGRVFKWRPSCRHGLGLLPALNDLSPVAGVICGENALCGLPAAPGWRGGCRRLWPGGCVAPPTHRHAFGQACALLHCPTSMGWYTSRQSVPAYYSLSRAGRSCSMGTPSWRGCGAPARAAPTTKLAPGRPSSAMCPASILPRRWELEVSWVLGVQIGALKWACRGEAAESTSLGDAPRSRRCVACTTRVVTAAGARCAGDTSQNLMWRLMHGELPRASQPRLVALLVGTNDLGVAQMSNPQGGEGAILAEVDPLVAR